MELKQHTERNQQVMKQLKATCSSWYTICDKYSGAECMNQFLQHCIFPRCNFTPADAVFCSKFVQIMHAQGTPLFSTLQYFDKLLKDVSVHVFCSTERQAKNLGNFLSGSLNLLEHWKSEDVYKQECSKLPGEVEHTSRTNTFLASITQASYKSHNYPLFPHVVFFTYATRSSLFLISHVPTRFFF